MIQRNETDTCKRIFWDDETKQKVEVTMTIHNAILFDYLRKIEGRLRNG